MNHNDVIVGIVYDFAAFLTGRKENITCGATEHPAPLIEAIKDWTEWKGLDSSDANVKEWEEFFEARE